MTIPLFYEDRALDVKIYARLATIGKNPSFGRGMRVVAESLTIGDNVTVGAGADLRAGDFSIGGHCHMGPRSRVLCPEQFSLGGGSRMEGDSAIETTNCRIGDEFYFGVGSSVGLGGRFGPRSSLQVGRH